MTKQNVSEALVYTLHFFLAEGFAFSPQPSELRQVMSLAGCAPGNHPRPCTKVKSREARRELVPRGICCRLSSSAEWCGRTHRFWPRRAAIP